MATPIREDLMARAIELSRNGFPAPNPHVGCVIERDGEIVGEGFHDHAGGPHAEVNALAQAGQKAKGATAYVTLEPCNHHGRTGPCSEALLNAGVARVVIACPDLNPRAMGGAQRLREAGVEVVEGVMLQEAREANEMWITAVERKRPYIVVKAAMTLDAQIAMHNGESKWITGEAARKQAHMLRAECGTVLVGRKTVEWDDPALTVRHVEVVNQPTRIVLDPKASLPKTKQVFNDAAPTIHVTGTIDLPGLMDDLYTQGIVGILVEGGAVTIGSFFQHGLVDRLELFYAPKVLGDGLGWVSGFGVPSLEQAPRFTITRTQMLEPDLWVTARPILPR